MIEDSTVANQIVGNSITPEELEDQSTYCSELFRLWGIFVSLKQLLDTNNFDHGHVIIACEDGQLALTKVQSNSPTKPEEVHYNLISAIKNL